MNLTVTLTQKEADDIAAWVGLYRAHPEMIGVQNTAWPPNGQTRIVLDSFARARFDEIAAQFPVTPPGPTPTDPEAAFMARAAIGQNCAWGTLCLPAEQNWAAAKWGQEASLRINAYAVGGANVMERREPDGSYSFVKFEGGPDGTWYPDVKVKQPDGSMVSAADLWCAEKIKPNSLPGPLPKS